MELREIVSAHDPDEVNAGHAPAQMDDRINSVPRADDSFETADIDARIVGDLARGVGAFGKFVQAPVSFSGLPGVSSHQTRSSFNRLSANRLMARCAACGGLNEPPSRPMRMPLVWNGMACAADCDCIRRVTAGAGLRSRPCLPGAVNTVFEARQLFGADRAAGVEFAGGNPDLGAEAELAAVGELRRCVMQHDRGIDLVEEFFRRARIFGHDRIGVMRAVIVNMRDRLVEAVDDASPR